MLQSTWTIGLAATAYTGPPDAQGVRALGLMDSVQCDRLVSEGG
jgi:hypothetical protein